MIVLIIIAFTALGIFLFSMIRISVSAMFWFSKYPNDKLYMFKTYFPCHIIVLFIMGTFIIIVSDFELFIIYSFAAIYILTLLIWNFKLKRCTRKYGLTQNNNESQNPNLP